MQYLNICESGCKIMSDSKRERCGQCDADIITRLPVMDELITPEEAEVLLAAMASQADLNDTRDKALYNSGMGKLRIIAGDLYIEYSINRN